MEIPKKLTTIVEFSKASKNLKPDHNEWAKINKLVEEMPEYKELIALTKGCITISEKQADPSDWTTIGLLDLLEFSQTTDTKKPNIEQQKKNEAQASFAISTLIAKGYGNTEGSETNPCAKWLVSSPHLQQWVEKFGTENLGNILWAEKVSLPNLQYLLKLDKSSTLPDRARRAFRYVIKHAIEETGKHKEPETAPLNEVITEALLHLRAENRIGYNKESFDMISECFHDPNWTKIVMGEETSLNLSVGAQEKRSVESLSDLFIEKALGNPKAWTEQLEFFKLMINQCPIDNPCEVLAEIKSSPIFEALLQHPNIAGKKIDLSSQRFELLEEKEAGQDILEIAKLIIKANINISIYQLVKLAELGLDVAIIKDLSNMVDRYDHQRTALTLATANRPDLLLALDLPNSNWYKVGTRLQETSYTIHANKIEGEGQEWIKVLEGPHSSEIKAGIVLETLGALVGAPNSAINWAKTHKALIDTLDINSAAVETHFLGNVKKGIHNFLQLAAILKLTKETINTPFESNFGSSEVDISAIVTASGKVGNIQSFLKLGGEITNSGIAASIGKEPILDYVLANSTATPDKATLTKYLKTSTTRAPNFLKLLKRADFTDMVTVLKPIIRARHSPEEVNQFTEVLVNKAGAQECYIALLANSDPNNLSDQLFTMLEYCVDAGANPEQVIITVPKYEGAIKVGTIEDHLGPRGKLLIDGYKAKLEAIKTLDANKEEIVEIDIF